MLSVMVSSNLAAAPSPPTDFITAKMALRQIYRDHQQTFYCDCSYQNSGSLNWQSCGFATTSSSHRAKHIEWEHIMPASRFGHTQACWQQQYCSNQEGKPVKGRECCRVTSASFNQMEADLHNLVPAVGLVNKLRSNFDFIQKPSIPNTFGECKIWVSKKQRKVAVEPKLYGTIARAYLYMAEQYGIQLSSSERAKFTKWHQQYPPTAWEKERNQRISSAQGNHNHYING